MSLNPPVPASAHADPTSPPAGPGGAAIGPYRLQRLLGRGAHAAVHLAVDTRSNRAVALKALSPAGEFDGGDFSEARTRFLQEAETAKSLSHPHIVKVYEAGDDSGCLWMAMQLLPGTPLTRYIHLSRLLPQPVVTELGEGLANALAHAHGLSVVHRDIKPGNVIFDLPTRRLKLTDFGIAGLADMSRTRTGIVLGTPWYMAPEQLAGAAPDARCDIYSLGVLLFQLLSGRLPHESASLGELLRQVARDPAPDVRRLRDDVPAPLAAVVARALEKQAGARFADARQMAAALSACATR